MCVMAYNEVISRREKPPGGYGGRTKARAAVGGEEVRMSSVCGAQGLEHIFACSRPGLTLLGARVVHWKERIGALR